MCKSILLAVSALLLIGTSGAQTISTESSWDGSNGVGPFGNPDTATYGQTITVSNDPNHFLDYFTFHLRSGSAPFSFRGYVMSWSGTHATGSVLYQSGVFNFVPNADPFVYQPITFNTGGLDLAPGQQYVLFISVSNDFDAPGGGLTFAGYIADHDAYTGGTFVFMNNWNNTSQWTGADWSKFGTSDLAFDTNLPAPVPEPASLFLLGSGLIGIGGSFRKRFIQ